MTAQSLLIIILAAASLSTILGTLLGVIAGFCLITRYRPRKIRRADRPEQTAPLAWQQAHAEERLRNAKD
ncbi:MAG: hypothetical protein IJ347_09430 [Faecalibacterium sp.]|nr:hypothetical protein [Faecalibacterium sp.]